jgi:hypothetical protein
MGEKESLTVGEFSRTIEALRTQIATGFTETHRRQDATNGRLLQAEKTIEVLSTARLIDRTDRLEGQVQQLESDAARNASTAIDASKANHEASRTRRAALFSAGLTFIGGLLLLYLKAKFRIGG